MAVSINTNQAALVALQNLNKTSGELQDTQNRVSTGLKVTSAKDDAALWSIAHNMKSQVAAYEAVTNSLNRGKSTLDVASTAGTAISDLLNQMKQTVLAASDASLDAASRQAYQQKYQSLAAQITTYVKNASFNGANLIDGSIANYTALADVNGTSVISVAGQNLSLAGGPATKAQLVAVSSAPLTITSASSFDVTIDGTKKTVSLAAGGGTGTGGAYTASDIQGLINAQFAGSTSLTSTGALAISGTVTGTAGSIVLSNFTGALSNQSQLGFAAGPEGAFAEGQNATTGGAIIQVTGTETFGLTTDYSGLINKLNASVAGVSSALATLGSASTQMENHANFVSKLTDSLNTGIGNLVDADLAKESANLQALQIKQQLGTQALSIANQAPQIILSLLKGG